MGAPQVLFMVRHARKGTTPEHLEQMFAAFYGSSLTAWAGLAVSRSILETHGGRLMSAGRSRPDLLWQGMSGTTRSVGSGAAGRSGPARGTGTGCCGTITSGRVYASTLPMPATDGPFSLPISNSLPEGAEDAADDENSVRESLQDWLTSCHFEALPFIRRSFPGTRDLWESRDNDDGDPPAPSAVTRCLCEDL